MTKKKNNQPADDKLSITEISMPKYHEDLLKLELPKDDVRLTSSDSLAITEINNRLHADARSKFFTLRKIAEGIEGLQEKWQFWNTAKRDYKNSIDLSMSYQSASGQCSMSNPGQGQWLDALIDNELAYYREQMRFEKEMSASSVKSDDSMKGVNELLLLHELGVIEFLYKRSGIYSPSTLSHIFPKFMNITQENAKKILQRLGDREKENYKPEQYNNAKQTIRDHFGEMKPIQSITFDPKEE
jgi:hypothetical protein